MGLFKKRVPEIQTIEVEKIVEKEVEKIVEVPVKSRFTFVHDEEIGAVTFNFNHKCETKATDLSANDKFVCFGITEPNGCILYPVFRMPMTIATTRMTAASRINCIGVIGTDPENTIIDVNSMYAGLTMEQIMHLFDNLSFNCDSMVTVLTKDSDVFTSTKIEGEIDYQTFCSSIQISHNIYWIKHLAY